MDQPSRNIVINLLPQGSAAWQAIAFAALCLSAAWGIQSMAGCAARSEEARYRVGEEAAKQLKP